MPNAMRLEDDLAALGGGVVGGEDEAEVVAANLGWSEVGFAFSGIQKVAGHVGEAIRRLHPWGVDACSRLESSPGKKDHVRMAAFIERALAEAK